jgi:PhnB protein
MNLNPYVQFGGRCAQAFDYYRQHLDATDVVLMPFRGSPAEEMVPPEWRDKAMHGSLSIGAAVLMGSDGMPGQPLQAMQGCALALSTDTPDDAERIFNALAQGGQVTMPIAPSFFAARFGMLTDQFGVAWMVICEAAQ